MNGPNKESGDEFSVRDQFAGRQEGPKTDVLSAALPSADMNGSRERGAVQAPLRRPVTADNMLKHIDWAALGRGVLRRVWLIVLIAAATTSLGLLGAVKAGRVKYDARASLLYRTDRQKQTLASSGSAFAIKGLARGTALSLLRRTSNMEAVRTNLHLKMTADELRWRIQVKSDKSSEIILLTVDNMPTADSAVKVANESVRVALEDNRDFYRSQAIQSAERFQQQASLARKELDVLNSQLTSFQATNRMLEVAADTAAFLDSVAVVSERLSAARIAYDSQLLRIENYRKIIKDLPDEVLRESLEDNPLKRRISNTEVALMEARTKYGPANPRVQILEDEIKEMRRTMAEKTFDENRERVYEPNPAKKQFEQELLRLNAERSVLEEAVKHVSAEMADVERKFAYLPQKQIELAGFIQRRAATEELCRALEKSMGEAKLAADLDLADFELLESSRTGTATHSKLASLLPVLGLLLGLIGGTIVCVAVAWLDPRLRTAAQIELAYSAPCLGVVAATDTAALGDAFLPISRSVYQRWTQRSATDGAGLLAVLSAQKGEGKSTLAFQLAKYWAGLGVKTAYLDFDSEPSTVMNVPSSVRGIEDYLSGRAAWENVQFIQDNVACFKLLADAGNLPERLHGKAMVRLLETLRANYGCVVIDTPAFLENRSAEMLALLVERTVWIIDASRTLRTTVNIAFDELDRSGIRPMGIILNFAEQTRIAR